MEELDIQLSRLHELYDLLRLNHDNPEKIYYEYLKKGLDVFGLSLGVISRIKKNDYVVKALHPCLDKIKPGTRLDLKDTYCSTVMHKNAIVSFDHIGKDPVMKNHPVYLEFALESYIAAPIWVNKKIYGALSFTSKAPRDKPFTAQDHEFIGIMAQGLGSMIERDILDQEKQHALQQMRAHSALFGSVFENAAIGMALVTPDGQWHKVNQSLVHLFGYDRNKLLTLNFQTITHPDDLQLDLALLDRLIAGEIYSYQLEKRYLTNKNEYMWALLSVSLVYDDNRNIKYYVAQIQSISELKEKEKQLQDKQAELAFTNAKLARQATEDTLTGVANRRKFIDWFEEETTRLSRSLNPISLAIIDIDLFKSYNDNFGHLEGDNALRQVAGLLDGHKRRQDKLARFGGEEFIMLFPDTDEAGSHVICERLRNRVAECNVLGQHLTISIGCVTIYPTDTQLPTLDEMIFAADKCLYEAKNNGRNQTRQQTIKY